MHPTATTLERLESYYDSAPRDRSWVEEIGPLTLFVASSGWPNYARPRLGETTAATVDDIRAVFARQRELGLPEALEWVDQTTPGLVKVVRAAGAKVQECPLLVLDGRPKGHAGTARVLSSNDQAAVSTAQAAIAVAFDNGGTSSGEVVESDPLPLPSSGDSLQAGPAHQQLDLVVPDHDTPADGELGMEPAAAVDPVPPGVVIAAHCEGYCGRTSATIRTARSRSSSGYLVGRPMNRILPR